MADRAHPKTHVEDQDFDGLRKQPLSPRHEGIDPLTESDTMLPRENTKAESTKLSQAEAETTDTSDAKKTEETVSDQKKVEASEDAKAKERARLESEEINKNGHSDKKSNAPKSKTRGSKAS